MDYLLYCLPIDSSRTLLRPAGFGASPTNPTNYQHFYRLVSDSNGSNFLYLNPLEVVYIPNQETLKFDLTAYARPILQECSRRYQNSLQEASPSSHRPPYSFHNQNPVTNLDKEENSDVDDSDSSLEDLGAKGKELETQAPYLPQCINQTNLMEIENAEFIKRWNELEKQQNMTASEMNGEAKFVEITTGNEAAGSKEATSCILAFVKAVVEDNGNGKKRTYIGSIHVGATDDKRPFDMEDIRRNVFKPLDDALRKLNDKHAEKEYYFIGGNEESRKSCRVAVDIAKLHGLNIKGCLLPSNQSGQCTDALLTKDGFVFSRYQIEYDNYPIPVGMNLFN